MIKIFDRFVVTSLVLMVALVLAAFGIGAFGYYVLGYDFMGTDAIVEGDAVGRAAKDVGYEGFAVPIPKQDWIMFSIGAAIAGFMSGYYWTRIMGENNA